MKKLRRNLVGIVFGSVVAVFILMTFLVLGCLQSYNNDQADMMTQIISENNGTVPKLKDYEEKQTNRVFWENKFYEFNEESAYRTRYFCVSVNQDKEIVSVDMEHIAAVNEKRAQRMTKLVLYRKNDVGNIGTYRYRKGYTDGKLSAVIFLDCRENHEFYRLVLTLTIGVEALLTILITVIFAVASKRVVRPFEINSQKQKQFITDASHELKTPLAIISANAEVLQYKGQGSEWLDNIIEQSKRMGKLINQLLTLAKLDEVQEKQNRRDVDMSDLVKNISETFREVLERKNVTLQLDIEKNTNIKADPEQMEQLFTILMDNAAKYVSDNGSVIWKVEKSNHGIDFSVSNTSKEQFEDTNRLFDRFYRNDSSRSSKTGGHGIGLSIAKKITDSYKGNISVRSEENFVTFYGNING